ncbi:MAG TPA: MBL fold metallo-hydrolase [Phycisphaerales bacterium]|nr:MBL fold metallo-hydrolase [Phycisphaerales bacterium]
MPTPSSVPLIEGYALGPFGTNCYIVHVPPHEECWIVDASYSPQPLIERVRQQGLKPSHILLTHAHGDHIAGLDELRAAFPDAKVFVHENEASFLTNPVLNLSGGFGTPVTAAPPDGTLRGGESLNLSGSEWSVLHTPGHSPGGITFYNAPARAAIVGDVLFEESVGRFDFPTSNEADLQKSIRHVLYKLPDDTRVYPGHGRPTTIGHEKKHNPFVREE